MPKEILVDASAWIAVSDKNDNWHSAGAKILPRILRDYQLLVTTNLVVAETHIALRQRMGFFGAMAFVVKIRTGGRLVRVISTNELELEAEEILKQYDDQDFSYTDAISFAVMKQRGITDVFTYDKHFRVMGFRIIR